MDPTRAKEKLIELSTALGETIEKIPGKGDGKLKKVFIREVQDKERGVKLPGERMPDIKFEPKKSGFGRLRDIIFGRPKKEYNIVRNAQTILDLFDKVEWEKLEQGEETQLKTFADKVQMIVDHAEKSTKTTKLFKCAKLQANTKKSSLQEISKKLKELQQSQPKSSKTGGGEGHSNRSSTASVSETLKTETMQTELNKAKELAKARTQEKYKGVRTYLFVDYGINEYSANENYKNAFANWEKNGHKINAFEKLMKAIDAADTVAAIEQCSSEEKLNAVADECIEAVRPYSTTIKMINTALSNVSNEMKQEVSTQLAGLQQALSTMGNFSVFASPDNLAQWLYQAMQVQGLSALEGLKQDATEQQQEQIQALHDKMLAADNSFVMRTLLKEVITLGSEMGKPVDDWVRETQENM